MDCGEWVGAAKTVHASIYDDNHHDHHVIMMMMMIMI